jgi:hypothetical protein
MLVVLGAVMLALYFLVEGRVSRFLDNSERPPVVGPDGVAVTAHKAWTTRPLGRDELRKPLLAVDLPGDARDIQFAMYYEWQAHVEYVSFRAPPETCTAYAKAVLDEFNQRRPSDPVPGLTALVNPPAKVYTSGELPVSWFTPHTIQTGAEGGTDRSHQPKVWVDSARGTFYYQYRD